jgi:hypothetical protein
VKGKRSSPLSLLYLGSRLVVLPDAAKVTSCRFGVFSDARVDRLMDSLADRQFVERTLFAREICSASKKGKEEGCGPPPPYLNRVDALETSDLLRAQQPLGQDRRKHAGDAA